MTFVCKSGHFIQLAENHLFGNYPQPMGFEVGTREFALQIYTFHAIPSKGFHEAPKQGIL